MRENIKLLQKSSWLGIKPFWRIFIPSTIVVIIITVSIYSVETGRKVERLLSDERNQSQLLQQIMSAEFELVVSDLMILSENKHLQVLLVSEDPQYYDDIGHDFISYATRKKLYDQIRFLDETGMEIVRVNFNDGEPALVAKNQLQDKGTRYYFQDTFQLDVGEVFISPFDLNIENGEIEQPLKPMIRFGTPVFDSTGQKRGIVILNYFGSRMIQRLYEAESPDHSQIMLLNTNGYWLKGPSPEEEWGFMYSDRDEISFANSFPDAWHEISGTETGQFQKKIGLYTFNTIHPLIEGWKSSSGSGEAFVPSVAQLESSEYYWKVVSHVPQDTFYSVTRENLIGLVIIDIVLILFVATVAWITGRQISMRERISNELSENREELKKHRDNLEMLVEERTLKLQESEKSLQIQSHTLGERVKELDCLYNLTKLVEMPDLSLEEFFQRTVDLIPPGWQYPEIACSRIEFDGKTAISGNFKESEWKQTSEIVVKGKKSGVLEVYYLEQRPESDEGPFLKEERNLIEAVSDHIGDYIERKQSEEEINNYSEKLEQMVDERTQELHLAQEELIRKEKLATLGELGGGVAHELRNPLGVIANSVYFLKSLLTGADNDVLEYLDIISSEIKVSAQIIENLLGLTHKKKPNIEKTLVAELIAGGFRRQAPPEGVKVSTIISDKTVSVLADPSQIFQVVENLLSNAYQAMPDGGELTIKSWEENNNVLISVADTGCGIPEEDLGKIFEPLFTTKARGIGLGLALSRDLISANNGSIDLHSVVGEGTTFTINLPSVS